MSILKEIILCVFYIVGPVITMFGAFYGMYGLMLVGVGVFMLGRGLEALFKTDGSTEN